jgi:hypothetical protein
MPPSLPLPDAKRAFLVLLAVTTLLKLWLAAAIPFIGDEAYFYQWGMHPDWGGYYDHPPMAGWWLWGLQQISSHPLVLRLPAVLLWIVITFGMMDLFTRLQPEHAERRWLLGSLFLALPFTWSLNLITTDTPLIFFLFFSGYALIRGELDDKLGWYAASGVLLGLALLSKYFAGLLAIAYAVYLLPQRGGLRRLLVIALCALPFMLLNLAWNSTHCWNNILFNLINRNEGAHFSLRNLGIYLVMMVYLITPWTLGAVWRAGGWWKPWRLSALFIVPFVLFLLLSFYKNIGLHWVLAFLPFVFLLVALKVPDDALIRHRRWNLWLGLPHLIVLLSLAYLPTDRFQSTRLHADIVLHRDGEAVVAGLTENMPEDATLMAISYSPASLLAYHAHHYVPVFGFGSFHARFDDNITDFTGLDGKDIRIVSTKKLDTPLFTRFFDHVKVQQKQIDGATFWIVDGYGFRFEPYYEQVLKTVAATYYRVPDWLPLRGCQFLEQYGFI